MVSQLISQFEIFYLCTINKKNMNGRYFNILKYTPKHKFGEHKLSKKHRNKIIRREHNYVYSPSNYPLSKLRRTPSMNNCSSFKYRFLFLKPM